MRQLIKRLTDFIFRRQKSDVVLTPMEWQIATDLQCERVDFVETAICEHFNSNCVTIKVNKFKIDDTDPLMFTIEDWELVEY